MKDYADYPKHSSFEDLKGKVFTRVETDEVDYINFYLNDGERFSLRHDQSCCESVYIESIEGDLQDLVDSLILIAEEAQPEDQALNDYDESFTWTFYKLATVKGYVTIRWYGTSNGCYSEEASLYYEKIEKK